MSDTTDIAARLSGMSADHGPDGWPAVQMRDITALCAEVTSLRAELAEAQQLARDDFDLRAEQRDERDSLRAALAQAGAGREPALWQFRWTNPAGDTTREADTNWKLVEPRNIHTQTLQQRIDELRAYVYDGKPIYEVRPLYARPSPAQRETLSDAEIAALHNSASACVQFLQPATVRQIVRAIERANGITTSGTKGAAS